MIDKNVNYLTLKQLSNLLLYVALPLQCKNLVSRSTMSDSDFTIPISHFEESNIPDKAEYGYKVLNANDVLHQRYCIVKELGSGGFATTYLAIDRQSNPPLKCAIKQLQPRFNSPAIWASARERLGTEAMVLQWLGKHPQIPQLLAHFEENKQFYLVLEFIEGEELEQEIHRQVLNEQQVIDLLFDVLEILEFVHQQGVIHRDIKPSNLIRRKHDGKITLIDFGAVKEIGTLAFDSRKQNVQTQIIGTPGYMPPEQNNGKPLYSSDIYALGKTAIFALTGKSPIEWTNTSSEDLSPWYEQANVSDALIRIISRMTAEKTVERYQKAATVKQDLQPLLLVGKGIGENYQVIKYLGGKQGIYSYIICRLETEEPTYYYLQILKPSNRDSAWLNLAAEQITKELANLTKIEHKSQIPQIVDYFVQQNNLYLIQEYIEGDDLSQIIKRNFILSEEEVIDLLIETLELLANIHRQQIIHGNIQPSSLIRRSYDNKISLVDFGLIQEVVNSLPDSTGGYVPPEQIAGRAIFASDIYALGMSAIHVLTGIAPSNLEKNTRTGAILWHRQARIGPGLAKILDQMIRLDKKKRYQSAVTVIKDLRKIKYKSKFRGWYKFIIPIPILLGLVAFGLAQWAQRAAILEFSYADIKLEAKQYQQAVEYYDSGLRKLPKTSRQVSHFEQVWLKKAQALIRLKRYDEALETCNTALRYHQSDKLWNCKALALDSLQKYSEAIAAYNKAIAIDPDYLWAWNNRGEAYAELGKIEQAKVDFEKAIKLDQAKSYVPLNNLGKMFYQQKDYAQAVEYYQQAIAIRDDYIPALIGLGNTQKNLGRYDEAILAYEQAIDLDQDTPEAWFGKGLVEESLRQYSLAQQSYHKAFTLKPDWEIAIKALQRVERKLGIE